MKVRIDITQNDIDIGVRESSWRCPVALGMKRAGLGSVDVLTTSIGWSPTIIAPVRRIALPIEASKFIRAFDKRQEVSPFSFEIDLPEEA